jgi:hypothetical protein
MRRSFIVILLLLCAFTACKQNNNSQAKIPAANSKYDVKIKIPSEWIERVRTFSYKATDTTLLMQFEGFIKPDTLHQAHWEHIAKDYGKVFNPIFVDLDGEPGEELICLLGWDVVLPYLAVFKQIDNTWYLVYLEDIGTFYGAPSLSVANNYSKNKTFYFSHVDTHGTGVYQDSYSFYKLISNKVYHCFDLVNNSFGYGAELSLSHDVKTKFEFSSDYQDRLNVAYTYKFFAGYDEDTPLIKGDNGINYLWDAKHQVYKLEILNFKSTTEDLTAPQIKSIEKPWSDSLFVSAFADRIKEQLKSGSPEQKKSLAAYLNHFKTTKVN